MAYLREAPVGQMFLLGHRFRARVVQGQIVEAKNDVVFIRVAVLFLNSGGLSQYVCMRLKPLATIAGNHISCRLSALTALDMIKSPKTQVFCLHSITLV